jgi:hypothetical protein
MDRAENKSSLLWLWILLAVGAIGLVVLALIAGIVLLFVLGWSARVSSNPVSGPAAVTTSDGSSKAAPITRDEFKAKVIGKTTAEVLEAVGKPDSTALSSPGNYWYYQRKTFDPVTGKNDQTAAVTIEKDKAVSVNFW